MGTPVIITPRALNDLREIVEFIARDDEERAEVFGRTLRDKALGLGAHPKMGRIVPGQGNLGVREIVHGSYRIIYELLGEPAKLFVLRFWHGARGTPQIVED